LEKKITACGVVSGQERYAAWLFYKIKNFFPFSLKTKLFSGIFEAISGKKN